MTVIVKPRVAPVDTSDEVITAWLNELLGSVSWPQFEATENGNLTILNTKFSMRIGIFMTMPTQAIFAEGMFLRMRQRKEFDTKDLRTLIADNIDSCLYKGNPRWKPQSPPTTTAEEQHLQDMIKQFEEAQRQSTDAAALNSWWHQIQKVKEQIEIRKYRTQMPPIDLLKSKYGPKDYW
jgi:hypothetical protein